MADLKQMIPNFFRERCVFITGATGFMGKVLMEKLLRSCPDIKRIYILVRPKRGKGVAERVDDLLNSKLFCSLHEKQPNFKSKVIAISGDITQDKLGLNYIDEATLLDQVSVVFHAAATVKFDEELKLSVEMNVLGVKRMIDFCKKAKHLEAFLHVSTAYANCNLNAIDERVYDPPLHPRKILDAVDWMGNDVLNTLTPKMIGNRPNTYTYTKSIAEYLIKEECKDIPTAIFRPSIVGASLREPCPGWVDSYNGPTGIIAAAAAGLLTVFKGDRYATADIIPVDLATNMMIAVVWYTAHHRTKDIAVYHCTTGQLNNVTWETVELKKYNYFSLQTYNYSSEKVIKHSQIQPFNKVVRVPRMLFTQYTLIHDSVSLLDQVIPSYILDTYLWSTRQKPIFVKSGERLKRATSCLEYFTANSWTFKNDNFQCVLKSMSSADRKEFNFDPQTIHWSKYFEGYCLGIKQFILREKLEDLPRARRRMKRLQALSLVFHATVIISLWRLLANRGRLALILWNHLMTLTFRIFKFVCNLIKIQ